MPSSWMDGLFLLTLPNQGSLDLHLSHSKSLPKLVSEQTGLLDGVDECIRSCSGSHWDVRTVCDYTTHYLANIHVELVKMEHYCISH